MALLATQTVKRTGLNPTFAAAAGGGDEFTPGDRTFLYVKNGSAGSITVTVVTPKQAFADVETADLAVAVPAGENRMIGPLPPQYFANPADGRGDVTYSGVTSLTIAAIELSA